MADNETFVATVPEPNDGRTTIGRILDSTDVRLLVTPNVTKVPVNTLDDTSPPLLATSELTKKSKSDGPYKCTLIPIVNETSTVSLTLVAINLIV